MRLVLLIAVGVLTLGLSSCGEESAPETSQGNPALLDPTQATEKAPDVYRARFTTTKGDFVIEVHRDWTYRGADRFFNLIQVGFFDDTSFFRVVHGFVVQFGLNGDPAVNAVWKERTLLDDDLVRSNSHGTVTFALSGKNTRTTQVFINLGDNSRLDTMGGFSPFGKIVEGMDVVKKLYGGYGDMPSQGGRGPDSTKVESLGNDYAKKNFPKLDWIVRAVIEE